MSNKSNYRKDTKSSTRQKFSYIEEKRNYSLILIFYILCIIPIIVKMKNYNPRMSDFSWFTNSNSSIDFFSYYKQWNIVFIASVMAIMIGYKLYKERKQIKFTITFIPLAIYAILVLFSSVASKYASYSFSGSFENFQSVFAVIGYCIIAYFAFIFVNSEKDIRIVWYFLIGLALFLSVIGIFQFMGHDFYTSPMGKQFIIPLKYQSQFDLSQTMGSRIVYLSMFNPNYVGVYVALIVPVLITMLFFQKKIIHIILSIAAIIGLIICLIGSKSLTGVMALIIAGICMAIFMWRYLWKKIYITIPVVLLLVISFFVINHIEDNYFTDKIANSFHLTKTESSLSSIKVKENCISLNYKGNILNVQYVSSGENTAGFLLYDDKSTSINGTYNQSTNEYTIDDSRFSSGIVLSFDTNVKGVFIIQVDGKQYRFTNQTGDNKYYYVNHYNKIDKIIDAPAAVFNGHETFGSGRGYIWSRTIPLLKNYIVLGCGADAFTFVFPQQDYINLTNYGFNGVMTKPHNMFLQMAVESGMISLIAFLIFYGMYFVSSIRLYIRGRFHSLYAQAGVAIFIGTIAYMFMGLANDSNINVAPFFWTLIGIGLAVNYKAAKLIKEEI